MQFKRYLKRELSIERICIVPFIDLLFLLLAFIIFSSVSATQSGITIKLPKTITSDKIKEENIVITITSEDVIYFNNAVITAQALESHLNKSSKFKKNVLIKSDRLASIRRIVEIWDICRRLNIEQVNIATSRDN